MLSLYFKKVYTYILYCENIPYSVPFSMYGSVSLITDQTDSHSQFPMIKQEPQQALYMFLSTQAFHHLRVPRKCLIILMSSDDTPRADNLSAICVSWVSTMWEVLYPILSSKVFAQQSEVNSTLQTRN